MKGIGKAKVFKTFIKQALKEPALVVTASSKSHEEIELAGEKKLCLLFPTAAPTIPPIPYVKNNLFRK